MARPPPACPRYSPRTISSILPSHRETSRIARCEPPRRHTSSGGHHQPLPRLGRQNQGRHLQRLFHLRPGLRKPWQGRHQNHRAGIRLRLPMYPAASYKLAIAAISSSPPTSAAASAVSRSIHDHGILELRLRSALGRPASEKSLLDNMQSVTIAPGVFTLRNQAHP